MLSYTLSLSEDPNLAITEIPSELFWIHICLHTKYTVTRTAVGWADWTLFLNPTLGDARIHATPKISDPPKSSKINK
jgi:hypothetical protein